MKETHKRSYVRPRIEVCSVQLQAFIATSIREDSNKAEQQDDAQPSVELGAKPNTMNDWEDE